MQKYPQEIIDALKETAKNQAALTDVALEVGDFQKLFNAALNCYSALGQLIETLEDQDENMDPEKTNLPNLDDVFAGDPASEYVDAIINLASGAGKMEDVKAAAERLAAHQNDEKPKEEGKFDDSIEGFAKAVTEHCNLTGAVAQDIATQLVHCFSLLEGKVGPSVGFKALTVQGTVEGTVFNTETDHVVVLNGKEYGYKRKYEGFCSEYPTEPVADQEEIFNALHPEVEAPRKEVTLADYVTNHGFGDLDPMELLDVIQTILDRRSNIFSDDDYKLVRFYLKQKPFNDPEEIDSMSDRALELAWKRYKYMRNVK